MLEIENLVVAYDSEWDLHVSTSIPSNAWTSIVGPSGSGKSTLLMAVAGFTPIKKGTIRCDGSSMEDLPPYDRSFGFVFQSHNLFDHLSIQDNLLLAVYRKTGSKSDKITQIKDTLAPIGIPLSYLSKLPQDLSGGERARVAVARAIISGHQWVLLDEAFGSLDRPLRLQVQVWIERTLRAKGVSVVSVTHQAEDALLFSDHIVALEKGRVLFSGSRKEADQLRFDMSSFPLEKRKQFGSIFGECSQIEVTQSDVIILTEKDFWLEPENNLGSNLWEAISLREPIVLSNPPGWILRDKGTQTLFRLQKKPEPLPKVVWVRRDLTSGAGSHPK